jgi:uncharacterized protein YkwD
MRQGGRAFFRLLTAVVMVFFAAVGVNLVPAVADEPGNAHELSRDLEHQTFDLINQYRTDENLPPLVWNPAIADMARKHSRDMATGEVAFGHGGFGDRMATLRGMFAGMRGGGENVFYTDAVPNVARLAVQSWLHSPPHLHNIRGDFQYSGLGLWRRSDGAYFFTQIFVKAER